MRYHSSPDITSPAAAHGASLRFFCSIVFAKVSIGKIGTQLDWKGKIPNAFDDCRLCRDCTQNRNFAMMNLLTHKQKLSSGTTAQGSVARVRLLAPGCFRHSFILQKKHPGVK